MKQVSLKFKEYAHNAIVINNNAERVALKAILGSFFMVAIWYILILGNIVFNIMERKTAEAEARALSAEVGDLELAYLAMSQDVDLDFSYSLGFKEVKAQFATRKAIDLVGLRTEGGVSSNINLAKNDI